MLVDGAFVPSLSDLGSLDKGLTDPRAGRRRSPTADVVAALSQPSDDPLVSLNAALMTDGVVIDVAADAAPARPLHIVHVSTGNAPTAAGDALADPHRRACQGHAGRKLCRRQMPPIRSMTRWCCRSARARRLDHIRLMEDEPDALNISTAFVDARRSQQLQHLQPDERRRGQPLPGLHSLRRRRASRSRTNGVNLLKGEQHGDTTLFVDHAVPHCTSRELFRSVLDGAARSVFQGRIIVRPGAQKTDAKMMTRALLLSDAAEADHKPELEIFADDVTCGHGATAGALDEDLLFYLRARGLPEKEAQALLIQAFVGEAIEAIVRRQPARGGDGRGRCAGWRRGLEHASRRRPSCSCL